ncbi:MAG: ABC transporter ATP-binding protein [Peptococcaceae bacterium]|nr:ABC transporter ATP-binding protein [Peptococcaceae bacterium]
MLKLIKHLKPFALTIIFIVMLLFVQALCDLSLPDYMSDIVNVGIQQGGIEDAVPDVIRLSELDKITLFLDEGDKAKVKTSYSLLTKNNLSSEEYENYVREYPRLESEPLCKLKAIDKTQREYLNSIISRSILLVSEMNNYTAEPEGLTPLSLEEIKRLASQKLLPMEDSMITQAAVNYIRQEYKHIGLEVDRLQINYVLVTGLLMLFVTLLSVAATITVGYLAAKVAAGLSRDLRRSIFRKVIRFSSREFDHFSTASLITRSTNDIQQIQMLMVMLLRIVFYAPILGMGGVLKILNTDFSMTWIIGVALAAILTVVISMFGVVMPKFKLVQKLVDRLNLVTREILTGTMVIRAFNNQDYEERKFHTANTDLTRTNLFVNRVMALMFPIMMLIMNMVTLLIVWVGAHQVDQGVMQVGNIMAFIQYAMMIITAFLMISMVSIMLPRAAVSAERIAQVLETNTSIQDAQYTKPFLSEYRGRVEFQKVSFRYPGAQADVLSNISFVAQPGQTTAIVGGTGSGKTTLINLLLRFYDVTDGRILVNGTDIRQVPQQELRQKIGYTPQKALLFAGSIKSNLQYGVESASESELLQAARIAQALDFIEEKPEGLEADIAQGGANVSGGQRQRLAIARALVKKPEIYIFDDSFSALDFKTDAALRRALKKETKESTVIIVAQRINTIMDADQIIVLEEGKIAGLGTHEELMQNCEVYRQIALSQFSEEELA